MFFLGMCVVSFVIAAGFAWVGAWLILPFAGLEMLVLALALKSNLKACSTKEVVMIDNEHVCVEVGRFGPEHRCCFVRNWTEVLLLPAKIAGYPSHLYLRSAGKQVELGACLDDKERKELSLKLQELIRA